MTEPLTRDDEVMGRLGLDAVTSYLRTAGWAMTDDDGRTTLWHLPGFDRRDDVRVVLPARQTVRDYPERLYEAIRVLAYVERRLPSEVTDDIGFGGADTVAARLTPDAPSGEAPLGLAHAALTAMRSFIVGSASALVVQSLVLPPRRPARAESYGGQARVSMRPGSFVLTVSLPLNESPTASVDPQPRDAGQDALVDVPPQPFGRRVTNRMIAAARRAQQLADDVSSGNERLEAFGRPEPRAPNATELAAMSELGGPEHGLYQLRFARSPLAPERERQAVMPMTPGQQRILAEAADFLRTKQPRAGVMVQGLVVRLARQGTYGPGEIVVQGVDDDTGTQRRFRLELAEDDYNEAVRAHQNGLQVVAIGDLEVRGTRMALMRLTSFAVLPGLEDD